RRAPRPDSAATTRADPARGEAAGVPPARAAARPAAPRADARPLRAAEPARPRERASRRSGAANARSRGRVTRREDLRRVVARETSVRRRGRGVMEPDHAADAQPAG